MITRYQVRSKAVSFKATFKTLAEARDHIKKDFVFSRDNTVFIVKIEKRETVIEAPNLAIDNPGIWCYTA